MTPDPTAAELVDLVLALPGVHAIEPGVSTTLRALDARIRRSSAGRSHFGLHIDRDAGTVTAEVCVDHSRPVRECVAEIQKTLRHALEGSMHVTDVHVRVQSLAAG